MAEVAATLFVKGCLWNTFVLMVEARTLIAAGRECVKDLNDRLARLAEFFGTEHEGWAVSQAYVLAPREDFSRAVLPHCPEALAVSKLAAVAWCDLGSPDRVVKTLTSLGISPPWLATLPPRMRTGPMTHRGSSTGFGRPVVQYSMPLAIRQRRRPPHRRNARRGTSVLTQE
jgi:hypothetical protein